MRIPANMIPNGRFFRSWSRMSGVALCPLAETDSHIDEILEIFKNAVAVGSDATETVAAAIVQANVFISSLQSLHAQVIQDQEAEWKRYREAQGQLLLNLRNSVFDMIKSFRQGADAASESVSKLKEVCAVTKVKLQ
jgi:hypothetical protein